MQSSIDGVVARKIGGTICDVTAMDEAAYPIFSSSGIESDQSAKRKEFDNYSGLYGSMVGRQLTGAEKEHLSAVAYFSGIGEQAWEKFRTAIDPDVKDMSPEGQGFLKVLELAAKNTGSTQQLMRTVIGFYAADTAEQHKAIQDTPISRGHERQHSYLM